MRKLIPRADYTYSPHPMTSGLATDIFAAELSKRIIGQPDALRAINDAYNLDTSGFNDPTKPICSLLFLGPTGTGKTRTVEAVAESFGNPNGVIKIDCAEYSHGHEVAKLVGAPPGYEGSRVFGLLSETKLKQHRTAGCNLNFILFDEIEKSGPDLWNILLEIMDKATLGQGDNSTSDLSRAMIFMTSNVGAREMADLVDKRMGYAGPNVLGSCAKVGDVAMSAAKRKFAPEFLNRLDGMIVFRTLSETNLASILELELTTLLGRIAGSKRPFVLQVTEDAKRVLLTQGFDAKYGARHLKRAISRNLTMPLSRMVSAGDINTGDIVECFTKQSESIIEFRLTGQV